MAKTPLPPHDSAPEDVSDDLRSGDFQPMGDPADATQPNVFFREPSNQWLLTYTDLVSLILAFFVLLFSMSTLTSENWDILTSSLSRSDLPPEEDMRDKEKEKFTIDNKILSDSLNLDYLSALLETKFSKAGSTQKATLHHFGDQLIISLPSDLLFTAGSARLSQDGKTVISDFSSVLRNLDNRVDIFGHADPDPVTGGAYTSNWELSLARALTVSDELQRSGYIGNINAYGAAASQFSFISPRISYARRKKLARRVDIIIASKSRLQE